MLPLARTLLLRPVWRVSGSLRFAWFAGWAILLAVVGAVGLAWRAGQVADAKAAVNLALALGFTGGVGAVLRFVQKSVVSNFAVSYFGDVARYLDRAPENVAVRQKIRSEAAALLQELHDCGRYDRIVVVGHSLGSVIAYDVLIHAYGLVNAQHGQPASPSQDALQDLERCGAKLGAANEESSGALREQYRALQRRTWIEQRRNGSPWLVTDLVTAGSPLTHARMLLVRHDEDLARMKADRELPTAPPVFEKKRFSYRVAYRSRAGQRRDLFVLHHAALFGPTRWTNIWYPSRFGVFGDWFGGPVATVFGPGVADIPISAGPWTCRLPIVPHTQYFSHADDAVNARDGSSITELRRALDLDSADWLSDVSSEPPTGPVPINPEQASSATATRAPSRLI